MLINEELERCRRVREEIGRRYKTLDRLCAHLRQMDKALGITPDSKPRHKEISNKRNRHKRAVSIAR